MKKESTTALVSAFARVFHAKNNLQKIFDDRINLLTDDEYENIALNMTKGISFFNPDFKGDDNEALRWVVNHQLSPTPLGRTAYAEESLATAVTLGVTQYMIFGAGLDTFCLRQPDFSDKLHIFELDHPLTQSFKKNRLTEKHLDVPTNTEFLSCDFNDLDWENVLLNNGSFQKEALSFCTLLGLSYYLTPEAFERMIQKISHLLIKGSSLVFDYPDEFTFTDNASYRVKKQLEMASYGGESMLAAYSYEQIEQLLQRCGFAIYEHLNPSEITERYFSKHGSEMTSFENVNYLLAVKQ
ncbi:class I SAM-dependent methyltransferase [Brevibacillus daliensis]|uniref:class I SAM-dependent methyltransferase n=1 Tax=Brevibacillus daliensis TaxID=2892995 RepID=UPI001E42F07B|nr:class I SAM-dependent methyltransferase [Brevibacillus daliensis]